MACNNSRNYEAHDINSGHKIRDSLAQFKNKTRTHTHKLKLEEDHIWRRW
ncbi:FAD_binding_3 domain-containing protein [Psidium guajava]|nr:FAD_binding_3 domain-containing protein [Psidium guajava]